jgi:hypothetical protein
LPAFVGTGVAGPAPTRSADHVVAGMAWHRYLHLLFYGCNFDGGYDFGRNPSRSLRSAHFFASRELLFEL